MGKSSQTEKFRMKTRLDINLGTQIRLRISTDINLRRVKKIKFSFRGTSNTSSFIHLNANLGWVSHVDGIPVQFSCLFWRENRSKIFRQDTRLLPDLYQTRFPSWTSFPSETTFPAIFGVSRNSRLFRQFINSVILSVATFRPLLLTPIVKDSLDCLWLCLSNCYSLKWMHTYSFIYTCRSWANLAYTCVIHTFNITFACFYCIQCFGLSSYFLAFFKSQMISTQTSPFSNCPGGCFFKTFTFVVCCPWPDVKSRNDMKRP